MAANSKYKVVFREENRPGDAGPLPWEPGSPLLLSAVQISRNTETSEAYLQVRALNITDKMVGEVHAVAAVQYSDGSSESLTLDDLDADVATGSSYIFDAARLSRGDAVRADVRIRRVRLADGGVWNAAGEPVPIAPGDPVDLPANYAPIRSSYLAEAGCIDVASATYKASDHGAYWACTCGQVNLADRCIKCRLGKQVALNSEKAEFLDAFLAKKKEAAAEAERKKQQQRGERIGLVAGICIAALVVCGFVLGLALLAYVVLG